MVLLKEITEKSWIVLTDNEQERIGLLSCNPNGFTLISRDGKVSFASEQDVKDFFEEDIFQNIVQPTMAAEAKEYFIKGYPVDFDGPFEADPAEIDNNLPLFTKTKSSKVYHCAGYYCILFPKGWTHSFCPKLSTLDKYKYTGPFKTEMEMKAHLSTLKQNDKRD